MLYSQKFYQNQCVLFRSIYTEPVLTSREECNVFADLFFRIYLCLSRYFVNQHVFFAARFTLRQPKTPAAGECNEFADLLFWRLYHYALRDSLSCDTRSLDLCILFRFIFLYLWYIPPHSGASHTFYFTPIFSGVYYHAKYFSYPCCSAFNYYF